ncbi:hypothetical protein FB451DRAFT_1349350 [Mycena latifolia]|nr:hypothetical protein FB451DRAFT_1349350 [Mycena latifolia]
MEVDNDPEARVRVQELWFEDGNLIIQAGSSLFRVYRGVLAARSSVFQDMLSFPQPPDSELVEGCPLVHMHDSAADVTVFLKAIFDSEFFETYPSPTTIDAVTGVLRLSHKYAVDYLRRRALGHLSSHFFTQLSALDASEPGGSKWRLPSWVIPEDLCLLHLIQIIQLVREVNALWILPYTFYRLAEKCAHHGPDVLTCIKSQTFKGSLIQLREDDEISFVKGFCVQISSVSDIMCFLRTPSTILECTSKYDCLLARLDALEIAQADSKLPEYQADPLLLWYGADWGRLETAVCATCLKSLQRAHEKARQDFWDRLPPMYGLPEWEELEKMKADALSTA